MMKVVKLKKAPSGLPGLELHAPRGWKFGFPENAHILCEQYKGAEERLVQRHRVAGLVPCKCEDCA